MKVRRGISFEVPGNTWRKENLEADLSEFPEADHLSHRERLAYARNRLEQDLLYLRWLAGNITTDQYREADDRIESLCSSLLGAEAA